MIAALARLFRAPEVAPRHGLMVDRFDAVGLVRYSIGRAATLSEARALIAEKSGTAVRSCIEDREFHGYYTVTTDCGRTYMVSPAEADGPELPL